MNKYIYKVRFVTSSDTPTSGTSNSFFFLFGMAVMLKKNINAKC